MHPVSGSSMEYSKTNAKDIWVICIVIFALFESFNVKL